MSLGFPFIVEPVDDAVNNAVAAGIVVVVAAGNSNVDACGFSPASAANVTTVGATARNDERASDSNFGTCIDIFAPGVDIISCSRRNKPIQFSYLTASVTSMASPHAAGVAALLLEEDPSLTCAARR
jgi:subtilisin family serine protease